MASRRDALRRVQVFAVVRHDTYSEVVGRAFTVKAVLPTLEEAEAEVARLNESLRPGQGRYYVQTTRFYPGGRKPPDQSG